MAQTIPEGPALTETDGAGDARHIANSGSLTGSLSRSQPSFGSSRRACSEQTLHGFLALCGRMHAGYYRRKHAPPTDGAFRRASKHDEQEGSVMQQTQHGNVRASIEARTPLTAKMILSDGELREYSRPVKAAQVLDEEGPSWFVCDAKVSAALVQATVASKSWFCRRNALVFAEPVITTMRSKRSSKLPGNFP